MSPIVSPNVRVRYPDTFEVGEHSIVDDYCYFATRVRIGACSHVANNCSTGGERRTSSRWRTQEPLRRRAYLVLEQRLRSRRDRHHV